MSTWTTGAVLVSVIAATARPVGAQEMVEVPTDPEVRARIEAAQPPKLLPAPSASEPIPTPVVAPRPYVKVRIWRYERQLDLMWSGVGMLSGAYTVTALFGAGLRRPSLAIPVAGPMVEQLKDRFPPGYIFAFLDLAVQAAGIVVAVVAPFTRRIHWRDR